MQKIGQIFCFLDELSGKIYRGTAYGLDGFHCASIAKRHYSGNFSQEVKYFYCSCEGDNNLMELSKKQPGSIKVEFYGGEDL